MGDTDQLGTATAQARTPVATFDSTGTIRIGRDADNDIVLPDFWVSKKHAEIRRSGPEYHLVDLNSSNGIHHNGRRVPRAVLAPMDRFTIGRHEFLFDGMHLYQHDDMGPTSIIADDLTVQIKDAVLLDDVSFALKERTLLGIIGPSGCGKSTLLKSMTGFREPARGRLLYDGKDLYEHYSELRYRIGMVPQDDVLHRQLTVRRALRFAASLRFASDVPRKQRRERVGEVIELLGLTNRTNLRIDKLSGGQRKRTSVALELLTEPSLLALDEPTSGLDPALDKEVMRELRLLADRGRTVVVVTHSVLHLDLCDHVLVMCLGGRMGYFGPPDGVLPFFEAEDYADVFDKVTNDPETWSQRYRNSDVYRRYVGEVALELATANTRPLMTDVVLPTPRPAPAPAPPPPPPASLPLSGAVATAAGALAAAEAQAAAAVTHTQFDLAIVDKVEPDTADMVPIPVSALTAPPLTAPPVPAPAPAPAPPPAPAPAPSPTPAALMPAPRRSKSKVEARLDRLADRVFGNPKSKGKPSAPVVFGDSKDKPTAVAPKGLQEKSMTQQALHPVAPIRQFLTLCLRMVAVIFADRGYAAFLLGLPLALGVLSQTVPGDKGLSPDPLGYSLEAQRRLAVLIVGAAFMGIAVAIREIVNEGSIYRRERAIGLSPTAYLASKLFVFIIIDTIQVVIFTEIAMLNRPGPAEPLVWASPMAEIMILVTMVAITSTALGLLASALVRTTEQTTPILVVSVMAQLVLCGGLFAIEGAPVLEVISVIDPSRWGFAGAAATTNLVNYPFPDPLWEHTVSNWWLAFGVLLLQTAILIGATRLALRRFEPGKE